MWLDKFIRFGWLMNFWEYSIISRISPLLGKLWLLDRLFSGGHHGGSGGQDCGCGNYGNGGHYGGGDCCDFNDDYGCGYDDGYFDGYDDCYDCHDDYGYDDYD